MLYYLFTFLDKNFDFPGSSHISHLFQYLSFRSAAAIITSLLIALFFGKYIIKFLHRKQVGESVRDLGLEGQMKKQGTPTMGGIIILLSLLIPVLLFGDIFNVYIILMIITTIWLGFIGFLDDYIKVFKKDKKGLHGKFKILGQVSLGIIVGLTFYFSDDIVVRNEVPVSQPDMVQINAHTKLTGTEKKLSDILYQRGMNDNDFAIIRSKSDQALFQLDTTIFKRQTNIPYMRHIAELLHIINRKSKDLAAEMTSVNVQINDLNDLKEIEKEYVDNNLAVRKMLLERGIVPEQIPQKDLYEMKDIKSTTTNIPFIKENEFDYVWLVDWMGEWAKDWMWLVMVLVTIFIVTAVSNGANITDGLDGLAAGTSSIIGITLGILAYVSGNLYFAKYLNIMYIPHSGELVVFISAFIGSTVGFLWYNTYPAQVFMGDTGSLAIGGIIAVFAILIRKELLIPILCGIFLIENISVMLQVGYFKYTKKRYGEGRRIFLMAPLHHHYQKKGYPEPRIVTRFLIVGIILAVVAVATLKIR